MRARPRWSKLAACPPPHRPSRYPRPTLRRSRPCAPPAVRIAYRVLGSPSEADDVVQEAWIRWQATDRSQVRDAGEFPPRPRCGSRSTSRNPASTLVARRTSVSSPSIGSTPQPIPGSTPSDVTRSRSAVRVLLQKLSPAERAAYVLREAFDYPYRHVAQALGLTEENARQLVTRARSHLSEDHPRPGGRHRAPPASRSLRRRCADRRSRLPRASARRRRRRARGIFVPTCLRARERAGVAHPAA